MLAPNSKHRVLVTPAHYEQEGKRLEAYEKKFCSEFSLNITCSEIDAIRLREIATDSYVEEVPNGVDIVFFKPDECRRKKTR
ncbi:MAG: hypothetical protein QNL62_02420 [Gammaproteobacteria bacterium]|nr:hypothetical protein [Gammaproteobacteria bacterium]